jgi:hypothetical protein
MKTLGNMRCEALKTESTRLPALDSVKLGRRIPPFSRNLSYTRNCTEPNNRFIKGEGEMAKSPSEFESPSCSLKPIKSLVLLQQDTKHKSDILFVVRPQKRDAHKHN